MRQRFAAGKGVSRLLQAALYRLAEEVRVDGEPLRTAEDVDLAAAWVRRAQARRRLGEHWAEWIAAARRSRRRGRASRRSGPGRCWPRRRSRWTGTPGIGPSCRRDCGSLVPQHELDLDAAGWPSPRCWTEACSICRRPAVFDLDDAAARRTRAVADGLAPLAAAGRGLGPGLDGWDEAVAEVRRLAALRPDVRALRRTCATGWPTVAPEWAAQIDAGPGARR